MKPQQDFLSPATLSRVQVEVQASVLLHLFVTLFSLADSQQENEVSFTLMELESLQFGPREEKEAYGGQIELFLTRRQNLQAS